MGSFFAFFVGCFMALDGVGRGMSVTEVLGSGAWVRVAVGAAVKDADGDEDEDAADTIKPAGAGPWLERKSILGPPGRFSLVSSTEIRFRRMEVNLASRSDELSPKTSESERAASKGSPPFLIPGLASRRI